MKHCLICKNNTKESSYQSLCEGCISLLYYPAFCCYQCGIELHEQNFCGSCLKDPPPYSHTAFATNYQSPIDKWVMSLKFGNKLYISRLFAEVLNVKLEKMDKKYVLMPVPLHKSRLRKRGYNQAYEIAKELAKFSNRELNTSLIRTRNTAMQAQLKFKERVKNVKGAFQLCQPLTSKNIILIDDVMTTGNTLKECAKTLINAGAHDVQVLIFARKSL